MAAYLHAHEIEYYRSPPPDPRRAYEQLLERAAATAERADLLARQNAQLRNEVQRLSAEMRPMHKCSRCDDQTQPEEGATP